MNLLNTNQQSPKPGDYWDKTGMGISPDPFGTRKKGAGVETMQ